MALSRDEFQNIKKLPYFKSQVVSDSMVPVLKVGDRVVIEIGDLNLKRFDIIVIFVDGKLICHYIWKINSFVKPVIIQTRNMRKQMDIPIMLDDYLGKVVSHQLSSWQKFKLMF
jgi:signal peptidase I